jgi:Ca2+-transporting ATPase
VVAVKGAPEAIAELCHFQPKELQELKQQVNEMASDGLRVLGVAQATYSGLQWPASQKEFDFRYLGLIALADPVRPSAPAALQECYSAGIRVVMITGDYPVTAQAIARQIGLTPVDRVVTGAELAAIPEADLRDKIRTANIFARVLPEQKLRLVEAFKANGEIVAMTGDGVNDAPALKSAQIGIAMGGRGTDVARESAALVLLDDDFASIVAAIRMGRRIHDNLKKAVAYIFAIHVPIAGVALVPLIAEWPLILSPVHILFLELIIDPACSIAFEAEPEETDIMRRPPRSQSERLFAPGTIGLSVFQGLIVLAIVISVFAIGMQRGFEESDARALTFTTLVIANVSLIFTNRSWTRTIVHTLRSPNRALWLVTAGAFSFLALVLYIPFLRNLFRFSLLHPADLAICFAAGIAGILWFEAVKLLRHRR